MRKEGKYGDEEGEMKYYIYVPPSLVKKGSEVVSGPQPAKFLATNCTSYGTRGAGEE